MSLLARRIALLLLTAAVAGGMLALPVSAKTGPVASASKCKKAKKGKRRQKKKCNGSNPSAATLPGQSTHATPTPPVVPPVLRVNSLGVTDNPVLAGTPTQGQVTISGVARSGGQPVSLSSDSGRASVPSSVIVAPGQTTATFQVTTTTGTATTTTLTASIGGSSVNASLQVVAAPSVASVALEKQCLTGPGSFGANRVTLDVAPETDTVVDLSSDDLTSLTVPANVTVPSGSKSALFAVTTLLPTVSPATVTASLGTSSANDFASVFVTIPNPPAVSDLTVQPNSVTIGDTPLGTVSLACEAPPGGTTVSLSSSPAGLTVPPTVLVPAGSLSATFQITAAATGDFTVTATDANGTKQAPLHVDNLAS